MSETGTISIEELRAQHETAKEQLKNVRFQAKMGEKSEADAQAAKRDVDRIGAAIRRAQKAATSTNGHGDTEQVKTQAKASGKSTGKKSTGKGKTKSTTAAKAEPKERKKAGAPYGKPSAERVAGDFDAPVKLDDVKAVKNPTSVRRQPKGNKVRVCFKNKDTGTMVAIVDATLDTRFKKHAEKGRWVTVEQQSGAAAAHKTWEGAWFFARVPSLWSDYSADLKAKGEKHQSA